MTGITACWVSGRFLSCLWILLIKDMAGYRFMQWTAEYGYTFNIRTLFENRVCETYLLYTCFALNMSVKIFTAEPEYIKASTPGPTSCLKLIRLLYTENPCYGLLWL